MNWADAVEESVETEPSSTQQGGDGLTVLGNRSPAPGSSSPSVPAQTAPRKSAWNVQPPAAHQEPRHDLGPQPSDVARGKPGGAASDRWKNHAVAQQKNAWQGDSGPGGYASRGGYDDRRGGYDDRRGGYDDRRGGYDDRRGGYDDRRGGYGDRRGGYDDRRGGYDDRRGGYDDRRGGYDDRHGGYDNRRGGSSAGGGDFDWSKRNRTSSRDDGMRRAPEPVQRKPPSYGVVTSIKDKYGFLKVVSEHQDSDVFFHFDEIVKNKGDPSKIQIGDEIEFELVVGRNGKLSASYTKQLEAGSIKYDTPIEEKRGLYGLVMSEGFRPQSRRGSSQFFNSSSVNEFFEFKNNSRYWQGRILVMTEEEINKMEAFLPKDVSTGVPDDEKVICFCPRGLRPLPAAATEASKEKTAAANGDETKKTEEEDKKKRRKTVVTPMSGDVVKFDLMKEMATGRVHAMGITVVKQGRDRVKEILERQIESGKLEREKGIICALSSSTSWNPNSFGMIEAEDRTSKIYFAYKELPAELQPSIDAPVAPKEPEKKKGDFGAHDWRSTREAKAEKAGLRPGLELEFYVVQDPLTPERLLAVKIESLKPGSVCFEVLVKEDARAVVLSLQRVKSDDDDRRGSYGGRKMTASEIRESRPLVGRLRTLEPIGNGKEEETLEVREIEFTGDDMISPGPRPQPQDIVLLNIYRIKKTGKLLAKGVQLIEPSEEKDRCDSSPLAPWEGKVKRETGIVANVREAFGFIECIDRPGQMFFPLKEVVAKRSVEIQGDSSRVLREQLLKPGDVVSFQVTVDSFHNSNSGNERRAYASRVLKVKDPCRFVEISEKVTGIISKLPTSSSNKYSNNKGGSHQRKSSYQQSGPTDNGVIFASPSEHAAPEIFSVLEKFVKGELLSKEKKPVTSVEIVSPSGEPVGKNRKLRGRKSSISATPPPVATEAYVVNVSSNIQHAAREYANWFGLVGDMKQTGTENRLVLKLKKSAKENGDITIKAPISFALSSSIDKRHLQVGDKAEFKLFFDKKLCRHVARQITVVEPVKPKPPPPVKRRPNTETGVVSCLHENGFGFLQSCSRPERLFFHCADCDGNYRTTIAAGDEVEYIHSESEKGAKASSLRMLNPGTIVIDEPVLDPTTNQQEVLTGFISREPKQHGEMKSSSAKWKTDHPKSVKISQIHVPHHCYGRLVDSSSADRESKEELFVKPDWRRANELDKMVKRFAVAAGSKDGDKIWQVDPELPLGDIKELERNARRSKLYVGHVDQKLVIAASKAELVAYKERLRLSKQALDEEKKKENTAATAEKEPKNEDMATNTEEDEEEEEEEDDDSAPASPIKRTSSAKEEKTEDSMKVFMYSLSDIVQPTEGSEKAIDKWMPAIGDEVSYQLCKNVASKKIRATNIKLLKSGSKVYRGVIEGNISGRLGFVRPHVAGEGSEALFGVQGRDGVDERFKPGSGGRDGTVRFDRSEIRDGTHLNDGDEVEYTLIIDPRSKEAKAARIRLIKRATVSELARSATPPKVNSELIKRVREGVAVNAVARFQTAKGPDGTRGFSPGRGRNLPLRTKLRVTAKEFKPSF